MARSDILSSGVEIGLTLDRYAELLRIPEAAFNGLNKPDDELKFACNTIWKQHNRDHLAMYIAMAEERREQELGFYLFPKYTTEDLPYDSNIVILPRAYLKEIGEKTTTDIALAEAITYRDVYAAIIDPIVLSIATTVTDTDEIKVFYPDEDVEIHPSKISISGGTATIEIPRSRLVDPDLNDNRDDPLAYDTDGNFLTTVDVKRVYYDESEGAKFVWLNSVTTAEETQKAKPVIDDYDNAIIKLFPANYSGGAWTLTAFAYSGYPYYNRVRWVSGIEASMNTQLLTARLAHTLMPYKPIDCESVTQYWQNDSTVDPRTHTPYGNKAGAIECWIADSRMKRGAGGMFA